MKNGIRSLLVATLCCLTISQTTFTMAEKARQLMMDKLQQTQTLLAKTSQNIAEFSSCVLKGNCSSDKQKTLSSTLKASAAVLGTLILALVTAAAFSGTKKSGELSPAEQARQKALEQSPDWERNKLTFLVAVQNGDTTNAERMIKAGVHPSVEDIRGWNALSIAATNNDEKMVRFLLQKGAQPLLSPGTEGLVSDKIKAMIAGSR